MLYKTINGENFETVHSKYANLMIANHLNSYSGKTLDYYYQNPSNIKRGIYADWRDWYCNTDEVQYMEVISGNTFAFSLGAIYDDGNDTGFIHITKCHNMLYLV